jgi:hypothetical protein
VLPSGVGTEETHVCLIGLLDTGELLFCIRHNGGLTTLA